MQAEQQSPSLSLNDLASIRNLIEVVTQRGAFKANELSSVGVLFDKLNVFLEASLEKQQEDQASSSQGE